MRRALHHTGIVLLMLAVGVLRVEADALFDHGLEIVKVVDTLQASLRSLHPDRFAATLSENAAMWSRNGVAQGRDAVQAAVAARMNAHAPGTFTGTRPRILLDGIVAWALFDWEWENDAGRQILYLRRAEGTWTVERLDFDGGTALGPAPGFDPREAVQQIEAPLETMKQAAAALSPLDMNALEGLLDAPHFRFYDNAGNLLEGAEALLRLAFEPQPEGLAQEEMMLFVSDRTNRAIAFQSVGDRRYSLGLVRQDRWRIDAASFRVPIETLAVSSRGRLATTWGRLRQRRR